MLEKESSCFQSVANAAIYSAAILLFAASAFGQIDITRMLFTPPVVPETQTGPVRFEATITGSPASVAFRYNNVDRPMFDDGTNGDVTAGDGTWTVQFTAAEILNNNTPARVFRPFVGTCRPAGGGIFNIIGEVWTSAIGLRDIRTIGTTGQETDYTANYVATRDQLMAFDPKAWAQRFYLTHGDDYDFFNFVLVGGRRGNRFHFATKNATQGLGLGIFDSDLQYGSSGRLQGISVFPISSFFDGGDAGFAHETGHQWINFLSGTPFAAGTPHWPTGNIAINVMGFSIGGAGGAGGNYSYTFSPNGTGGYTVGNANPINISTFNSMELYLMGLIPPAEVDNFFVLNNPNQNLTIGQVLQPSDITTVTVNDVIAARGARVPDSTVSQKNFRVATIVISETLLDANAMAFFDYFARRSEATQQLAYSSGLASGTCNPWFLATGGRSTMTSMIGGGPTPTPTPAPTPTPSPTPTPATTASISGRVMTPTGLGLRNALVALTDPQNVRRTATTSSFGVYTFENVPLGVTYVLGVSSKRYRFTPKTVPLSGDLFNVDFFGLE